jgi:hypothetical protein
MPSIINSTTTSPGGLISTGASDNSLLIQTGDTTAITVSSTQQVALTNPLPVASGGTGSNTATFSGANITSLNASSVSSGTLAVARGGTGNATGASASVATTNWTVAESAGKLVFSYGGVAKGSLDSSGNFIVTGNVTAYGTP